MNKEIEFSPFLCKTLENGVHAGGIHHIAGHDEGGAHRFGQRDHTLLQRFALIGEGEFGAMLGTGLGNAPCNRSIIGNAHDEAAFALHQVALNFQAIAGDGVAHRFPVNLISVVNRAASYTKAKGRLTKKPLYFRGLLVTFCDSLQRITFREGSFAGCVCGLPASFRQMP